MLYAWPAGQFINTAHLVLQCFVCSVRREEVLAEIIAGVSRFDAADT